MRTQLKKSMRPRHGMAWTLLFMLFAGGCLVLDSVHAQSPDEQPSALQEKAEQLIDLADEERDSGRTGTALQHFSGARDVYMTVADRYPEWTPNEVQSRLFYCRQEISAIEQEMDTEEDLGSILDLIEQNGEAPAGEGEPMPVDAAAASEASDDLMVTPSVVRADSKTGSEEAGKSVRQTQDKPYSETDSPVGVGDKRFRKEQSPAAANESMRALQKQLDEAQAQNEQLEKQKKQMTRQLSELEKLQKERVGTEEQQKAMRREIDQLKDQLKGKDRPGSKELENARRELESRNRLLKEAELREQQLKKELQQARLAGGGDDWDAPVPLAGGVTGAAVAADSGREHVALEKKVNQLEQEKKESEKTVSELQQRLKDMQRSAKSGSSEGSDSEKWSQLEAENRKLTMEVGRLNDQLADLQRQTESRRAEQQVLSREIENTDAKWSQDNLKLKQELNRERSRGMELQETVNTLRASLDQAEQSRLELLKSRQTQDPATKAAKNEYEAQNAELKVKLNLAMQEATANNRKVLEYGESMNRLNSENKTLSDKFNVLQEDYLKLANSTTVTASENVNAKAALERLTREMDALKNDLQAKARFEEQWADSNAQLKNIQARMSDLENVRSELEKKLTAAKQDADTLKKEKEKLEMVQLEKAEWNQSLEQLRAKLDDAQVEKMDLDVALARATAERDNAAKLAEKIQGEYTDLVRKNEELEKQVSAGTGRQSGAVDSLNAEMDQLQQQIEQKDKKIQEMARYEKECADLRGEINALNLKRRDELKDTQLDLITQKKKAESLVVQNQELQAQLVARESEAGLLRTNVQQLEKEKEALEQQLDGEGKKQHEELLAIKKQSALDKEQAARQLDEISNLQARLKEATDTRLVFEKKLIESEKEKDDLEREINESDEAWRVKLAASIKDLQTMSQEKTGQEKKWQQDLAAAEGQKRKIEELTALLTAKDRQILELSASKNELEAKIGQAVDAATEFTNKTETELVRLQNQNTELRVRVQELEQVSAGVSDKDNLIKRYETELKAANEQLSRLNDTKKQWNVSNEEVKGQLNSIQQEVSVLTSRLNEAQKENGGLKQQLDAAQKETAQLRDAQKQSVGMSVELENLKKETELLRSEKQKFQGAVEQAKETERMLNETRRQLVNVQKSNELNVKLVDRMKNDLTVAETVGAQLTAISKERDRLLEQVREWQEKYDTLQAEHVARKGADDQQAAQVLQQTKMISDLNREMKEKQAQLDAFANQLANATAKLKDTEEAMRQSREASKTAIAENDSLKKQVAKLTDKQAQSDQKTGNAETRSRELEAKLNEHVRQKESLEESLTSLAHEKERLNSELERWKEKAGKVEEDSRERQKLQSRLDEKNTELNNAGKRIAELEKLRDDQQGNTKLAENRVESVEKQLAGQAAELNRLRTEKEELAARVESLTKELNKATETLESLANY